MTEDAPRRLSMWVRPGVPGARWVLAIFLVFAAVVLTEWVEGGSKPDIAAAPAPSHHTTTGSANKTP